MFLYNTENGSQTPVCLKSDIRTLKVECPYVNCFFSYKLQLCEGITFTLIQLLTFKQLIHSAFVFVKV